ncbi:hypothetical protein [Tannerella forsythia]|uniref:hypothetical protein n=1 Tax=Tannerella forsythia TaxID=28112 RepID=UPI0028EAEC79|nr:hypothetical protein [Tannerella forsythia]
MKKDIYEESIIDVLQAIDILKNHRNYDDSNKIFNALVEKLFMLHDTDQYDVSEDIVFGIEVGSCEYYSLAYIELYNNYACIPLPLLSNLALRHMLHYVYVERERRKVHNRTHLDREMWSTELETIRRAKQFLELE